MLRFSLHFSRTVSWYDMWKWSQALRNCLSFWKEDSKLLLFDFLRAAFCQFVYYKSVRSGHFWECTTGTSAAAPEMTEDLLFGWRGEKRRWEEGRRGEERRGEPGLEVDRHSLHRGWRPVWKRSCGENIVCKLSMKNGQVRCSALVIIVSLAADFVNSNIIFK